MFLRPILGAALSFALMAVGGCNGGSSDASMNGSLDNDPFATTDVTLHSSATPEMPEVAKADVRRMKTHPMKQRETEPLPGNVTNSYGMINDNSRAGTSSRSASNSSSKVTATEQVRVPETPTRPEHPIVALIGQTVPELDVEMMGGGEISLKQHRSSDVLVVVIWATYNPLCEKELHALKSAVGNFSSEQVQLLAVNDGEGVERIGEYLTKNNLELEVGMDLRQVVADAFLVRQLPFAAIIDKSGTIQGIHVGYIDTLGKDILKDLNAVVGGGQIIEESKARLSKQLSSAR